MKITGIRVLPAWSGERNHFFVVVETDAGVSGIGEAGLTGREQAVAGAVQALRPLLLGQDAFRTEHLWQVLSRGGFFPAQRVIGSAIAAIDIALWDIKGKALGVPVYELLGGRVRDEVRCYAHVGDDDGDIPALVEDCRERVSEGWSALRLALPRSGELMEPRRAVRAALAHFAAAREAVGQEVELILDVHTRLEPPDARWLCRELQPLCPYFVEDPLRVENLESYRRLREQTAVPLAAGEQLCSKWEFRPLIEQQLVDYARIDLCIAGGFTEARKIAAWCETHQIAVAPHNPLGPVATAATLHFTAALTPFGIQEQQRLPGEQFPEAFAGLPVWGDGALAIPEAPGLGLTVDEAALRERPPRWMEPPHLRRADGSFTNW